jgi:dihydrofolate reductase
MKKRNIYMIACVQFPNNGLSNGGEPLYRTGELIHDERFSRRTTNHVVLMSDKTAQLLDNRFPLEHRINGVITKTPEQYEDLENVFSLTCPMQAAEYALRVYGRNSKKNIYLLEEDQIFDELLEHYCSKILLTQVRGDRPADAFLTIPDYYQCTSNVLQSLDPYYCTLEYENRRCHS